jgi:hypothetical protein
MITATRHPISEEDRKNNPTADRVDASIREISDHLGGTHALNAQLIHRIALRGAGETVRDAMVHGNAMRTLCERRIGGRRGAKAATLALEFER